MNDPEEGNFLTQSIVKETKWLTENRTRHTHIASFIASDSKDRADDLVFWREYGRGGQGCSIMIPLSLTEGNQRLFKVVYGTKEAKSTTEIIQKVLVLLEPLIDTIGRDTLATIVWDFFLDRIRYLYKSDAYRYEHEWRFVLFPDRKREAEVLFEYQEDRSPRIRHYVEHQDLEVKNWLISGSQITLGPSLRHPENVQYCLKEMLEKMRLPGPSVVISQISYRTR